MPQITIDRSPALDHVDWHEFALALHQVVVETAGARIEACKTRVVRTADEVVGAGAESDRHAVVHVTLALLAGRSDETKEALTEAVLELSRKHIEPDGRVTIHLSAEVRDLDPSYRQIEME